MLTRNKLLLILYVRSTRALSILIRLLLVVLLVVLVVVVGGVFNTLNFIKLGRAKTRSS